MKHPWLCASLIGVSLFALFALDRSCNSDRELAKAKADYAEQVRALEADNAIKRDTILAAEKVITQQDANIAGYVGQIQTYRVEVSALRAELSTLQDAEPPTTPEVESLPIVINLRAQVTRLTQMFSLSEAARAEQDKVIASWREKYEAQVTISIAWKAQAENERTLRVQAESLFTKYEHARKSNKFWRTTAYIAGAVALGAIIAK